MNTRLQNWMLRWLSCLLLLIVASACGSSALGANLTGWGWNNHGQATPPASLTNLVAIAAGEEHSVALDRYGRVYAWGQNYAGQTNVPANLTNAVAIAAG